MMNERLLDGTNSQKRGDDYEFKLPTEVHRQVGVYADHHFDTHGKMIDEATWEQKKGGWLLGQEDRLYAIHSGPSHRTRQIRKLDCRPKLESCRPVDYEYVRIYTTTGCRAAPL